MKNEIKNSVINLMETYVFSVVRKVFETKINVWEKLNKIDKCSYQIVLFVAKKKKKKKKSTFIKNQELNGFNNISNG